MLGSHSSPQQPELHSAGNSYPLKHSYPQKGYSPQFPPGPAWGCSQGFIPQLPSEGHREAFHGSRSCWPSAAFHCAWRMPIICSHSPSCLFQAQGTCHLPLVPFCPQSRSPLCDKLEGTTLDRPIHSLAPATSSLPPKPSQPMEPGSHPTSLFPKWVKTLSTSKLWLLLTCKALA